MRWVYSLVKFNKGDILTGIVNKNTGIKDNRKYVVLSCSENRHDGAYFKAAYKVKLKEVQ